MTLARAHNRDTVPLIRLNDVGDRNKHAASLNLNYRRLMFFNLVKEIHDC